MKNSLVNQKLMLEKQKYESKSTIITVRTLKSLYQLDKSKMTK